MTRNSFRIVSGMQQGVCTYITWPEGTEIQNDFIRACVPVQLGLKERHMVVHYPSSGVQAIADRLGQKGLVIKAGEYR